MENETAERQTMKGQKGIVAKHRFLGLATLFYAILALLASGLNRLSTGDFLPFPLEPSPQAAGLAIPAAGILMAVVWLLVRLEFNFMRRILEILRPFAPLLIELNQAEKIYISILAGTAEELLFRGYLQPLLGIAAASLIFGALHAATLGYFMLAAAMGFYLGELLRHSGNLLVPMAVHALYDIFALNLLARFYHRENGMVQDR